jgi:pyruvate dehydrogenase E1 component beta subunit
MMTQMNMVQAINSALKGELQNDPSVFLIGEDIGLDGGVFRVTEGLQKEFGPERVIDTPLSEEGTVGAVVGMAINGLKPVVEIQFMGFSILALSQILCHISRMRNRSRGRFSLPLVIRMPYGCGVKAPEHHSESIETIFVHTPGLKVVVPSTPREAKGLLISSIRDPDPVIFLEPKRSYRLFKEDVEEETFTIPIGEARTVIEGDDVTVIGWGAMIPIIQDAVKMAESDGVSSEILDLRTLSPMDNKLLSMSVKKTGRAVIVHEAPRTAGLGAEIVSRINEKAFLSLEAPVERVTAPDVIVPLAKAENYYYVNPLRVYKAIRRTVSF